MRTLRVAVVSAPATAVRLAERVSAELDRFADLLDAAITIHRYRAPATLLGHHLLMAEFQAPPRRPVEAGACDADAESAIVRFLGELLERMALADHTPPVLARASEQELRRHGPHPVFDVQAYLGEPLLPDEWPFPRYSPKDVVEWTTGRDLTTGQQVFLPVSLCTARSGEYAVWCELTSNGTATHRTENAAITGAIRELYERDALRLAWLTGRALTPIDPPEWWENLREHDDEQGWRTRFFRTSTRDGTPLWTVLTRHTGFPLYTIGSSCSDDPDDGLSHALNEALQGRLYSWLNRKDITLSGSRIRSFFQHVHYYSQPERLGELDALCPDQDPFDGEIGAAAREPLPEQSLEGAVSLRLLEHADTHVVRVLHPRLQPIEAEHAAARLVGWARTPGIRDTVRTAPTPFV